MKKLAYILAFGLMVGTLASCSSVRYSTTRLQSLDFSQYQTYGWLPPVDSLSKNYFNNDIAKGNIITSANKELENKGLRYSKEDPDILFRYVSIVNNKSRLVYGAPHWGFGWGGPWGWYGYGGWYGFGWSGYGHPVGNKRYRYAHLIIEAVDRRSNSVVWQARGSAEVRTPEKAINKLPKIVHGILKQYPFVHSKTSGENPSN